MSKLINAISKLTSKFDKLKKKQDKFESITKQIQLQAQQFEIRLRKNGSYHAPYHINYNLPENIDKNIDANFQTKQLEFDIKDKEMQEWDNTWNGEVFSWDILLKALHFPADKDDKIGFAALRLAKKNNNILQLLQVSEDFLNLLAQEGIYLDDLKIEPPPIQAWRNFIKVDKNQYDRKLSCVGIESHLTQLKNRAKDDVVFRDTALMLLRRFDKLLRDHLHTAEDYQIFKIAETRSGKAFLIVGKISDIF